MPRTTTKPKARKRVTTTRKTTRKRTTRKKKRRGFFALFSDVFPLFALALAALFAIQLSGNQTHREFDESAQAWRSVGTQIIGIDMTVARQNIFTLARDLTQFPDVVDHGVVQHSPLVGISNFMSRGAINTVGDLLAWFDIPLTPRQRIRASLCQPIAQRSSDDAVIIQPDPWQYGIASWYGPGFHGQLAASGEAYNMYALTAAHRTLPLGSFVRVVSQRTGKSVVVRINDRGPYVSGRIIDLSLRARDLLNGSDLTAVYIERLDEDALAMPCR